MYEFITVVVARSYSRNSGVISTELETVIPLPASSSSAIALTRRSWSPFAYELSRQIVIAWTPASRSWRTATRVAASSSGFSSSPFASSRSGISRMSSKSTSGSGLT